MHIDTCLGHTLINKINTHTHKWLDPSGTSSGYAAHLHPGCRVTNGLRLSSPRLSLKTNVDGGNCRYITPRFCCTNPGLDLRYSGAKSKSRTADNDFTGVSALWVLTGWSATKVHLILRVRMESPDAFSPTEQTPQ